ncbi:MAG: hypothetical protein COA65_10215, partial [Rhodospirillaceae bacterium]
MWEMVGDNPHAWLIGSGDRSFRMLNKTNSLQGFGIKSDGATMEFVRHTADDLDFGNDEVLMSFGLSTGAVSFPDDKFQVTDDGDVTKILKFQLDQITTATTRTVTALDAHGVMALTSTVLGNQQIPYAGADGRLSGSALLTFASSQLHVGGSSGETPSASSQIVAEGVAAQIQLLSDDGQASFLTFGASSGYTNWAQLKYDHSNLYAAFQLRTKGVLRYSYSESDNTHYYLGDVVPNSNNAYDLGVTGLRWKKGWFTDLDITTNIVIGGTVDGIDISVDAATQASHIADGTIHFTLEAVMDQVDSLIVDGTNINTVYDDGANTLTINVDDAPTFSGLVTASASLAVTGNITVSGLVDGKDIATHHDDGTIHFTLEAVMDQVNTLIIGGTNINAVYDDGADTLTINVDNAPTFSGTVTAQSGLSGTIFDFTSGISAYTGRVGRYVTHGLFLHSEATVTHYNWIISTQDQVDATMEFSPSTLVGGFIWDTPAMQIHQNGNLTVTGTVSATGFTPTGLTNDQVVHVSGGVLTTSVKLGWDGSTLDVDGAVTATGVSTGSSFVGTGTATSTFLGKVDVSGPTWNDLFEVGLTGTAEVFRIWNGGSYFSFAGGSGGTTEMVRVQHDLSDFQILSSKLTVTGTGISTFAGPVTISHSAPIFTISSTTTNNTRIITDATPTGAGNNLHRDIYRWNGNDVVEVRAVSGSDTVNKDDGAWSVWTSLASSSVVERLTVSNAGLVTIAQELTVSGTGTSTFAGDVKINPSGGGRLRVGGDNTSIPGIEFGNAVSDDR